jgi:hypothetical protein
MTLWFLGFPRGASRLCVEVVGAPRRVAGASLIAALTLALAASGDAAARACIYNPVNGQKIDCRVRSIVAATGVYASTVVDCATDPFCSTALCIFDPLTGEPNCNIIQRPDAVSVARAGEPAYQHYVVQCIENEALC